MDWWRSRATSENHKRIQSVEKHRERSLGVSPVEVWLARASKDWKSFRSRKKPHGSFCPPFWIITVEWSGARSCLLMTSPFSDSIVFSVHTKKTAFSKSIVFKSLHSGELFRMGPFSVILLDNSSIGNKTAPFSFENGLVWTGSKFCVV